jgi:hypothetical protein
MIRWLYELIVIDYEATQLGLFHEAVIDSLGHGHEDVWFQNMGKIDRTVGQNDFGLAGRSSGLGSIGIGS